MATKTDTDALRNDVAAFKRDLATLADSLKSGDLRGQIEATVANLSKEATRLYEDVSKRGRQSIDTVSHSVEEKPLIWIAAAFVLGFIGSRIVEPR